MFDKVWYIEYNVIVNKILLIQEEVSASHLMAVAFRVVQK